MSKPFSSLISFVVLIIFYRSTGKLEAESELTVNSRNLWTQNWIVKSYFLTIKTFQQTGHTRHDCCFDLWTINRTRLEILGVLSLKLLE